jgi:hypothetical protein
MKHCLILTPLLLSSASAFTVNRQWSNFVTAQSKFAPLKVTDYDAYGSSGRIEDAYNAWCGVYNKADRGRLEIFAYHFLLAEKFFGQTGAPIKLNEFADLTATEYKKLHEAGGIPAASAQTPEFVYSEASVTAAKEPAPVAPAGYGPNAGAYLEALGNSNNAPTGGGMTSYLDSVPQNSAVGGAGITSYLDSMGVPAPYTPPAAPVQAFNPPVPAAPSTPAVNSAVNGGNYMDNLAASNSAGAPTGAGISSYLDTVPQNVSVGGAGVASYLDSVGGASPAAYSPFQPAAPVAAAPEAFAPPPVESAASAGNGGNYMDNLSATSTAPSGTGITSYLDNVPKNTAVGGGAGLTSYLDSVGGATPTEYTPFEPATPVAAAPQAFTPPPAEPMASAAPAQPYTPSASVDIPTGGNYMDNLSAAATGGAPTGAGITSYLDSVPQNSVVGGGTGMTSYLDSVAQAQPSEFVYQAPAVEVQAEVVPTEPVYSAQPDPFVNEEPAVYVAPTADPAFEALAAFSSSRNVPGTHWMDTVTPLSSYGARELNGNWDEDVQYQAPPVQQTIEPLASTQPQQVHIETFGGGFIIA